MQTSEPHTRSPVRLLYSIARREGAAALTRGLAVSFPYNIVLNGVRFSAYASLNAADRGRSANAGGAQLVHGALAGSLAGFLAAPLAQARTILQSEPGAASTDAARLGAALRALRERPLAGASSWAVRNGGHTAITFSLYGQARREMEQLWPSAPSALLALASSMQAAAVSCVLMNPVDLISTRLFHRASLESQLRYAGSATLGGGGGGSAAVALTAPRAAAPSALSCLTETLHSEGVAGLYRGLSANVLRIVPHTVITFAVLELLRDLRS